MSTFDATTWRFRRDERITGPRANIVHRTSDGICYLAPEAVLFYKGIGRIRPHDEVDFRALAPTLTDEQRAWLVDALAALRPEHEWLAALR